MRKRLTGIVEPQDEESRLRAIARAFELITGNRLSPPTIWRWKNQGCKGIKLPYVQVGGTAMISLREARKWLEEVTAASTKRASIMPQPSKQSARQRSAAERLEKELS